jgi:hypothetical protein
MSRARDIGEQRRDRLAKRSTALHSALGCAKARRSLSAGSTSISIASGFRLGDRYILWAANGSATDRGNLSSSSPRLTVAGERSEYQIHSSGRFGLIVRASTKSHDLSDAHRFDPAAEVRAIRRIAIAQQIARSRVPRERVGYLAREPVSSVCHHAVGSRGTRWQTKSKLGVVVLKPRAKSRLDSVTDPPVQRRSTEAIEVPSCRHDTVSTAQSRRADIGTKHNHRRIEERKREDRAGNCCPNRKRGCEWQSRHSKSCA